LRKQNLDGIDVRGVSDYTGIGSKKPKEKYIYPKKQTNKCQDVLRNDVIKPCSIKNKVGQGEGDYQDGYVYQNNDPSRQIA